MVKIETHIPMARTRTSRFTSLLKRMRRGHSLLLPSDTTAERFAWYQAAHRLGMKVSIRSTDDGARLWRVK